MINENNLSDTITTYLFIKRMVEDCKFNNTTNIYGYESYKAFLKVLKIQLTAFAENKGKNPEYYLSHLSGNIDEIKRIFNKK